MRHFLRMSVHLRQVIRLFSRKILPPRKGGQAFRKPCKVPPKMSHLPANLRAFPGETRSLFGENSHPTPAPGAPSAGSGMEPAPGTWASSPFGKDRVDELDVIIAVTFGMVITGTRYLQIDHKDLSNIFVSNPIC